MNNEFREGEIVQLNSGGPKMTIQKVEQINGVMTEWCQRFDGDKAMANRFNFSSLKRLSI